MANKVIPVLRIFDVTKAMEFYKDWLGFQVDWEHRYEDNTPLYMQVSKDDIVLHLTEHHGDCCPGAKVFVETTGLKEYHQLLLDKNYKYNRPGLEVEPWDAISVTVHDPFGNKILFSESIKG